MNSNLLRPSILLKSLQFRLQHTSLFPHQISDHDAKFAYDNMKLSRRGNPPDSRKLYWFNAYRQIVKARFIFVLQNTNLPSNTLLELKKDLSKNSLECLTVRNGLFSAAAKFHDPKYAKMKNLFQGPTTVWFSNVSDQENPKLIQEVARIATKYKKNVILVGGAVDGHVLTANTFNQVKDLPPKAVLYGELLGLLQYPGSTITNILSQTPNTLSATLQQHEKQLNDLK
ncbi:hypothetical protein BC833DRAFT_591728 [Globomyces pollinis-pini]|nr:hypothetical protein BC833DRAFT_591728 [Globomyces pollinis-pini]